MSTAAVGGLPAQNLAADALDSVAGDPLLHPDPAVAADCAATESLLRCWVRETGITEPPEGVLRVALGDGLLLTVPVRYWSATGWHRFGRAALVAAADPGPIGHTGPAGHSDRAGHPVDAVTVAALLARGSSSAESASPRHVADLAGRVVDSVRRTATFLAEHRAAPAPPHGTSPFLDSEQALLLGHPLHPTPKSREGLGDAESAAYSPELRGAHRLHWFAVDAGLAASDLSLIHI